MMFLRRSSMTEKAGAFVARIPQTSKKYRMPAEDDKHEGTWLQWPHNKSWDDKHVERYEQIFLSATRALCTGEKVHIIVYNDTEQGRVQKLLLANDDKDNDETKVDMSQIDFFQWPTDDVWVRDNGPVFVFDETNQQGTKQLVVSDWRFNGWGNKADYWLCNGIPHHVAQAIKLPWLPVPMVNEGGSIEVDGRGTIMAKKSSILNDNRNPGWKQSDVERYFKYYLGVTNFIWLTGRKGGTDISDDHIDGTARFAHGDTIVTMERYDFELGRDYDVLKNAKDANGKSYKLVHLPLTSKKLSAVGDYGIYTNYYVGNEVVIVPAFGDQNDQKAASILQSVYPDRKVVSIPMVELLKDGGIIHCVTMAQPAIGI